MRSKLNRNKQDNIAKLLFSVERVFNPLWLLQIHPSFIAASPLEINQLRKLCIQMKRERFRLTRKREDPSSSTDYRIARFHKNISRRRSMDRFSIRFSFGKQYPRNEYIKLREDKSYINHGASYRSRGEFFWCVI